MGNVMITKEQVKEARLSAGLSQEQAAKVVGRKRLSWTRWESGAFKMDPLLFKYFKDNA